jgi:hypothetical protein
MNLETNIGSGHRVQQTLQPLDVRGLLDGVNEALIPKPGGSNLFSHILSSVKRNAARTTTAAIMLATAW